MLCREFLSAHLAPSTPVVMSGSGNDGSSSAVFGGLLYDKEADLKPPSRPGVVADASGRDSGGMKSGAGPIPRTASVMMPPVTSTCGCRAAVVDDGAATRAATPSVVLMSASPGDPGSSRASDARGKDDIGGEREGGESGDRGGEGAPVDTCTVGDLYPWRNMYGVSGRAEQVTLGFLAQQVKRDSRFCSRPLRLGYFVARSFICGWRFLPLVELVNQDACPPSPDLLVAR